VNIIKALITQCGKTINAPANMILPMTKEQDADWKLMKERRMVAGKDKS